MQKYKAAIVGLGNIGMGYDYKSEDKNIILTHAKGYVTHPSFELVAGVEPEESKRKHFGKKFKRPAYTNLNELFLNEKIDVFSICVPTNKHYAIFKEILDKNSAKAIVCEKPLAIDVSEGKSMVKTAKASNCSLLVNYYRRFEPGAIKLKNIVNSEKLGEIYKATIWYSKGLLNNGSHFLDYLSFIFGNASDIKILDSGRKWHDGDPEPDFRIKFGKTTVYFFAGREECFTIFEMHLMGTKGRLSYVNSGGEIYYQTSSADPLFPDYIILDSKKIYIPNELNRYQWHVFDHLASHLLNDTHLNSTGSTALETLKIANSIKKLLE